jgi:uncharacterized protein
MLKSSFKKLVIIFIYINIAYPIFSQQSQSLLWKISGNGLQKPSYLFGTMHLLCAGDAQLSNGLQDAIKSVDEIYFEIDLTDMGAMFGAMKYLRMNGDTTLSDIMAPPEYAKLKMYFEKKPAQVPFSMLEHFKPFLISSLIEESSLPCASTDGMEWEILKNAKLAKKKINGLETASFQASLFDSIPYKLQAKELVKYLDSTEESKKMMDTLSLAYKNQDLLKIEELTSKDDLGGERFMDLLLYGRNRNWVGQMKTLLPKKSYLFAVGAGHLPGEKGLIGLLRKMGYTLSPIN